MRRLTAVAGEKDAGRRVKCFVRGDMGVSCGQFKALKARNGLLVNGAPVHANHALKPGDAVTVLLEDAPGDKAVMPEDGPVNVVYEDEDILILDKPAPLPCQCSPKQPAGTLENRLAFRYRDDPGFVFRPLNRLDKGTSGLMAAAKNAHAAQRLQRQLHTDDFVREYLAVVEGRMAGEGVIDAPIAKAEGATVRRIVDANGKPAVTRYRAVLTGERRSIVRLRLETGRTHQIRVHLSHIGHAIVGDFLYGAEDPALPGRFALHSTCLRLVHPVTGEVVERESPLPSELVPDCDILGGRVTVTMDRPLGSRHPSHPEMVYPVNYGFVRGIPAPDGAWQDAYVLGMDRPLETFTGRIVAIVRRADDVEDKWVVCPEGRSPDAAAIMEQIHFQEQYFDSSLVTRGGTERA